MIIRFKYSLTVADARGAAEPASPKNNTVYMNKLRLKQHKFCKNILFEPT